MKLANLKMALYMLLPLGILSLSALNLSAAENSRTWNFQVLLDDKPIGTHQFQLRPRADGSLQVSSQARFQVRFLGFTAYGYQHDSQEYWRGNCLSKLTTTTNDNGKQLSVRGQRDSDGFTLQTQAERHDYPACIRSFAYWNLDYLRSPQLLNTQTGELIKVQLQALGRENIPVEDGETVSALRYRLSGPDLQIDLWYSDQQRWLALESVLENNRRLRYRLQ
ncbi:MAG: DUF6134 family protein [Thiolinea sp.]